MNDQTRIQRKKNEPEHTPAPADLVQNTLNSGGQPLDAGTRAVMEPRFGHSFADVQVHADGQAAQSAEAVNALAYTAGRDIVFGAGQYQPGTEVGQRLLAHELTHVVQQRGTTGAVQQRALDVSQPGDTSEREAEAVADAVVRGEVAVPINATPDGAVQRAVKTNGGDFDTTTYTAITEPNRVGADIVLKFTPNDLVEADKIGTVQTNTRLSSPGGKTGTPTDPGPGSLSTREHNRALTAAEGDNGRVIDRVDNTPGTTLPTTSPIYGVHNVAVNPATGAAEQTSATVGDIPSAGGNTTIGSRKRKADGTFDTVDAVLKDGPRARIQNAGQQWVDRFETTALVLEGPMAGTYLGSVSWGWKSDESGNATLDPATITLVQAGAPTAQFMAAAQKWNDQTATDPTTGKTYNTADLPITKLESGGVAAANMSTSDIAARLEQVNRELTTLGTGADRTNKEFEKKALEAEMGRRGDQPTTTLAAETAKAAALTTADLVQHLEATSFELESSATPDGARTNKELERQALENETKTRNVKVEVHVISTEDFFGGDEVYVKLNGKRQLTHDMKAGATETFMVCLNDLLTSSRPLVLRSPMKVEVYDEDSPDADDLIVTMDWEKPFAPKKNSGSLDGANYDVTVQFDR